ncbi:hypothetical protein [Bacillus altitudinis]|nr:hypothetical protein [Bacillus altitudinis]
MNKQKALEIAIFFAEFQQKMIQQNRIEIARFSNKKMIEYSALYLRLSN